MPGDAGPGSAGAASREGAGRDEDAVGGPQAPPADAQPGRRRVRLAADAAAWARHHWFFGLVMAAAVLLRAIAMLGFQPAVLYRLDSYDYLWGSVRLSPNLVNVSGYSVFLWLLRPLHSLVAVVALQHVMGLGVATMVYVLLRRHSLPGWGATLAAAPVLLDPSQLLAEQLVLADVLAMTLLIAGLTVLLRRRSASLSASVAAGLLVGASVTVRPTALPMVALVPIYLLIRGANWQRAAGWLRGGAALVAGLVPVLAYVAWFAAAHGTFGMTDSDGLFLWSRTMSFADCAIINPPANLRALCPGAQPAGLAQTVPSRLPPPINYLWDHRTWQWQHPAPGLVPGTAPFTPARNERALRFAVRAIEAQPIAYLGVIGRESLRPFIHTSNFRFPAFQTSTATLDPVDRPYAIGAVRAYTGTTQGVAGDLGSGLGTRLRSPFAAIMNQYQHIIFLPGPVLALALLVGLAGCLLPRRRTAEATFLVASAVILVIVPIAEHEYTYRYILPAIPLMCIAAALALRLRPVRKKKEQEQASPPHPPGQAKLEGSD